MSNPDWENPIATPLIRHHAGTRFMWQTRLVHTGKNTADVGSWVCQRCAALVQDHIRHGDWHQQLETSGASNVIPGL